MAAPAPPKRTDGWSRIWQRFLDDLRPAWLRLFQSRFLGPVAEFPQTRLDWLLTVSPMDDQVLNNLRILRSFLPEVTRTLRTDIPRLRRELLPPVSGFMERFPQAAGQIQGEARLRQVEARLDMLHKAGLEMMALEQFTTNENILFSNACIHELDDLSALLDTGEGGRPVYVELLQRSLAEARQLGREVLALRQSIEENFRNYSAQTRRYCSELNQLLFRIKMDGFELRPGGPQPPGGGRGTGTRYFLERASARTTTILTALDKVESRWLDPAEAIVLELRDLCNQARQLRDNAVRVLDGKAPGAAGGDGGMDRAGMDRAT
ncbi:MAG: hypothetical protein H7841_15770 [Magnetospirillum sp. WYHS-4]